jgi:hypothetical protein
MYLKRSFLAIAALMVVMLLTTINVMAIGKSSIIINNPFNIKAILELKCNWDGKKFRHHRFYRLLGNSRVEIIMPNNSKCQLWPGKD